MTTISLTSNPVPNTFDRRWPIQFLLGHHHNVIAKISYRKCYGGRGRSLSSLPLIHCESKVIPIWTYTYFSEFFSDFLISYRMLGFSIWHYLSCLLWSVFFFPLSFFTQLGFKCKFPVHVMKCDFGLFFQLIFLLNLLLWWLILISGEKKVLISAFFSFIHSLLLSFFL